VPGSAAPRQFSSPKTTRRSGGFQPVLNEFVYTTIEVADGEEVVARFRERSNAIALVIFDVIVPKKKRKGVFEELRRIRQD
jgi:CheY-like chemotaxis protein